MKWQLIIKWVFILSFVTLINGCFMPSLTQSKGTVSVQFSQEDIPEKIIVVSLWQYPMVNSLRGKVVIHDVILTDKKEFEVKFPLTGYWIAWTPALGTQHIAPEPGIMIFHSDYPLIWNIGGTDTGSRVCCAKPENKHRFEFVLQSEEEKSPQLSEKEKEFLEISKQLSTKIFIEDLLAARKHLIRKLDKCKGITVTEKEMVLEKIKQIEMKWQSKNNTLNQ